MSDLINSIHLTIIKASRFMTRFYYCPLINSHQSSSLLTSFTNSLEGLKAGMI